MVSAKMFYRLLSSNDIHKMPAKKEPPHIVYTKQPSIQHKDPFQTEKQEKDAGNVLEKATTRYRDKVIERLKQEMKDEETE